MTQARSVAEVVAGEAVSGTPAERLADMRAIASVIANRATMLGVTQQQVVANQGEFNIRFWISSWSSDSSQPNVFNYKSSGRSFTWPGLCNE